MTARALRQVLAIAAFAALVGSPAVDAAVPVPSATSATRSVTVASRLPVHLFAPYVELWLPDRLPALATASGARYQTLAFLESAGTHSCTLVWNRDTRLSDPRAKQIAADVRALRSMGGDAIPSFGGVGADHEGREIADSCTSVTKIADAYQAVIAQYGAKRLDLDVEDASLDRAAGVERRNRALKVLQDRLAARGQTVQISYTLPVGLAGLEPSGLAVLRSAVRAGVRVDVVNLMVFDWYDGKTRDMAGAAIRAAGAVHDQLRTLYPARSSAARWAMIGLTVMPGIDDFEGKTEVTTVAHAQRILAFATSHGVTHLSMWALQRDNGGCPGTAGADNCSGITQERWAFSRVLRGFADA
jgi:hypothetical protein